MSNDSPLRCASPLELAEALRRGEMVVVLDDEDRENEGDVIAAAGLITPETINFMATHARGLICLAIDARRARQLHLPFMTNNNQSAHTTNFTVSIEASEGVSTGISAADRAHTILTAVKPDARPEDLVMPGHVFPLVARKGGVLVRAGHTEAGCDLTGMAGLQPAAVIVEVLNPDGSMARNNQLQAFAATHGLLIGTIAGLIEHRLNTECTIEQTMQQQVRLPHGEFRLAAYNDKISGYTHVALVCGDPSRGEPLVRVHQYAGISDALGLIEEGRWGLQQALAEIARAGDGVVLLLHMDCDSQANLTRLLASRHKQRHNASATTYISHGTGAQILRDLGVRRMRLLSSPMQFGSLTAFGLEIVSLVEPH